MVKFCNGHCQCERPISEFYNKAGRNGVEHQCRECKRREYRERRANRRSIRIAEEKEFFQINSGILSKSKESIRAVQPLSWFIKRFNKGLKVPLFCWLVSKNQRRRILHKNKLNQQERDRYRNDAEYRTHRIIKDCLDHFLKDNSIHKNGSKTFEIIGYTGKELISLLKWTLDSDMTWNDFMCGK